MSGVDFLVTLMYTEGLRCSAAAVLGFAPWRGKFPAQLLLRSGWLLLQLPDCQFARDRVGALLLLLLPSVIVDD